LPNAASLDELRGLLNPRGVPDFEAVAPKGDGVYDTLKAIARLILTELKKGTSEIASRRRGRRDRRAHRAAHGLDDLLQIVRLAKQLNHLGRCHQPVEGLFVGGCHSEA